MAFYLLCILVDRPMGGGKATRVSPSLTTLLISMLTERVLVPFEQFLWPVAIKATKTQIHSENIFTQGTFTFFEKLIQLTRDIL